MIFLFVKDQICFVTIKKKRFFDDRKIRFVFIFSKIWKRFFFNEENFIHKINLGYMD